MTASQLGFVSQTIELDRGGWMRGAQHAAGGASTPSLDEPLWLRSFSLIRRDILAFWPV
jgi:hypothetical protein